MAKRGPNMAHCLVNPAACGTAARCRRRACWWAKTGATEYGVVGWGTYVGAAYGDDIRWIPHPPTDRWSMSPLCSDELEGIIDRIRGGFNNATMFLASPEDSADLTAAIKAADR